VNFVQELDGDVHADAFQVDQGAVARQAFNHAGGNGKTHDLISFLGQWFSR
jgi:hypothetical protein